MDRKTIGRYEIIDELGRGAMGAVLRARDPAMGRVVALKCILSAALAGDQTSEFRERFYREARAAGKLAHPGIVPVFDVGEDDGVPFLVMELVEGRTLDGALKSGERYSLERVCEITQQLAEAMGYAHRNGVIHRDIKPANILMTSREVYGAERPRITDFGVAKLAGGEATTTGQLLGTPAFMPPEQFTGAPIDGRSDLFALGVILYRMTTGEQPFPGETLTAVSYKVVHTEPIPPATLNPAIPPNLEAVILKCLAKSPDARYQTGEELAADLAAVRPGHRTSGAYPMMGDETLARVSVAETIDQVSSLRPQTVATQMTPPLQTVPAATQFPVSAVPAAAAGAAVPAQSFERPATHMWPVREVAPPPHAPSPPPPVPARPAVRSTAAQPPVAAPPPQAAPGTVPAYRPTAAPAAPPQLPPQMQPPAPIPAHTYPVTTPAARPAPVPVPGPAPTPPAMATTASASRTYIPTQHPDSTIRQPRVDVPMTIRSGRRPAEEAPQPARKRGMGLFTWLIFIALAVGGTWVFLQIHVQQSSSTGVDANQPSTGTASAGPVGFNPKTLDPATNTKLALDLDALPSAVVVTLQMDGKTYWTGSAGDHDSASGLMVPPGQHSWRVLVSAGGAQKASGDVGAVFEAGKKMTLEVKLWPAPANGGFDPASDVVVSLHRSFF